MCRYGHHWLFLRIDNKLKSMFGANFFYVQLVSFSKGLLVTLVDDDLVTIKA